MKIKEELEAKKNQNILVKNKNQIAILEKDLAGLHQIKSDLEFQIEKIQVMLNEIQCEKDDEGKFKLINKQLEIDCAQLIQIEQHITELQLEKIRQLEQYDMILEDLNSHKGRQLEQFESIQWKAKRVEEFEKKIQNKKSKIYRELQTEQKLLRECQKNFDNVENVIIPSLINNNHIIVKVIETQDQYIIENLKKKEEILTRINENRNIDPNFHENFQNFTKLTIKKNNINLKVVEVQEQIKVKDSKLKDLKSIVSQQEQYIHSFLEIQQMRYEQHAQRQQQLIYYREQINIAVKPSIKNVDTIVKNINQEIDKLRLKLIKNQKQLNNNQYTKDYQMLSKIAQSPNSMIYSEYMNSEINNNNNNENQNNTQIGLDSTSQLCPVVNLHIDVDIKYKQDINAQQYDDSSDLQQNEKKNFISKENLLITYNNQDLIFRILPMIKGMEIYKKKFDTKLLNLNNQQKYDPLGSNDRISPDQLGYQLRLAKLNMNDIRQLELFNHHEDQYRSEVSIDLTKVRFIIPKNTNEAYKIIKEEKKPFKQISNEINQKKSKSQIMSPSKSQIFTQQEYQGYKLKCMNARYFSLNLIEVDKEYDILISIAGGHFNYEIFKKAVETIQQFSKNERNRIQQILIENARKQ